MLEQFPRKFVALLVADATPANGGGNQSGIATIDPGLEEATEVIAHEVAHTYWSYGAQWLGEGGATLLEAVSSKGLARLPLEPLKPTCEFARNILELERIERESSLGAESARMTSFPWGCAPMTLDWGSSWTYTNAWGTGRFDKDSAACT